VLRGRRPIVGLIRYVGVRAGQGVVVVFGAVIISFLLIHLTGNPVEVLLGGQLPREEIERISREQGYDRPIGEQFVEYISGVIRGDFGDSLRFGQPAMGAVLGALPNTLALVGVAVALASVVAVPLAVASTLHRRSRWEQWVRMLVIFGQGVPEFWLALLLVMLFSVRLGWLPSLGYASGAASFVLPALSIAVPVSAVLLRILRVQLLDISGTDFMEALRSKGLSERDILVRHGLRNASIPFLTFLGLQIGWLVGGALVVESLFSWPGIGTLLIGAVQTRDLPVIQAAVVVIAVTYVLLNLAVDVVVGLIDPRVRMGSR